MGPQPATFTAFEQAAADLGYGTALVREWAADVQTGTHEHDFDAWAIVQRGEMWLTVGGHTRHLLPGDSFSLAAGVAHAERYGHEGATFWVARRQAEPQRGGTGAAVR